MARRHVADVAVCVGKDDGLPRPSSGKGSPDRVAPTISNPGVETCGASGRSERRVV